MKQLNKPSDNLGGVLKIWAVPPSDITIGSNTVSFTTTENIVEMYCSPGSMSMTEKESLEKAGTAYQTELKAFVPKDTDAARQIIAGMTGRHWIVIYQDQNEQFKVSGTVQVPLRVSFDLDTGADTPDRNGHSVSFYGKQVEKGKFVGDPF
jgi:hypothetical protein